MAVTEKVEDIGGITVSATVMSKIIGVTDRRVRSLAQEGILIKASSGRYKLQDSIHNYILNLRVANDATYRANASDLEDELDLEKEKVKHERVKRHMSELKYALMKGEVHKSSDVEAVMTNMLMNFKTKILSIPAKLTPQLEKREKTFIEDLLTTEMIEILHELSEYSANDFYGKEYIDYEESDGEVDIDDDFEELVIDNVQQTESTI